MGTFSDRWGENKLTSAGRDRATRGWRLYIRPLCMVTDSKRSWSLLENSFCFVVCDAICSAIVIVVCIYNGVVHHILYKSTSSQKRIATYGGTAMFMILHVLTALSIVSWDEKEWGHAPRSRNIEVHISTYSFFFTHKACAIRIVSQTWNSGSGHNSTRGSGAQAVSSNCLYINVYLYAQSCVKCLCK